MFYNFYHEILEKFISPHGAYAYQRLIYPACYEIAIQPLPNTKVIQLAIIRFAQNTSFYKGKRPALKGAVLPENLFA